SVAWMPPHSEQIVSRICGALFRGSLSHCQSPPKALLQIFLIQYIHAWTWNISILLSKVFGVRRKIFLWPQAIHRAPSQSPH
ncbi:hypothetical protein BRN79_18550, partial [Xanthomonas oryzae pv. oryzae]